MVHMLGQSVGAYTDATDASGKSYEQIAEEGLSCMEGWMKELGLVMRC